MTTKIAEARSFRFTGWEVRPAERVLLVRGEPAPIGSRAFDVLLALIAQPAQVIGRSELLDAAWPGLVVEENNLSVQIAALRKVLGTQVIATIPGLGYRFTAVPEEARARPPDKAEAAAPPRPGGAGNLTATLAELIGRDDDTRALTALVSRHRIVSVVGAGGIGKTRLAQSVAQQLRDERTDAVWMVELAPLSDPALLPSAIAQALGIRLPGQKSAHEEVIETLQDSALLLVLDNCEHLIDAVGALVQALLERTRAVRILVTSQELLKLPDEHVYRLAPLAVPGAGDLADAADHGAVKLLATRVRALDRRFEINARNVAEAVEICRRLDGLPLAIELAAARVPLLGLAGVRERLDERFRVLTSGSRTGLRRHRTLRETLAWSHALLSPTERAMFRRAGVFAGSFGMEQAQHVLRDAAIDAWAVLELLGGLVDKSLVVVEATDPPRYRLLESTRAYALEMLQDAGETQATLRQHALAMNEHFAASRALQWRWPSQVRLQRFLPDLENGRVALDWAAHADPQLYISLAGGLAWLFGSSGQGAEGELHARKALERIDAATPPAIEARLLHEMSGLLHDRCGAEKLQAATRAVALFRELGDRPALYSALWRLAICAAVSGDSTCGENATREMAALFDPSWPDLARWELLNARDFVANLLESFAEAEALAAEQLTLATTVGDTYKTLFAMLALEQCAATRRDYLEAIRRGRELVAYARQERYVEKLHVYIANLATALVMADQTDEALLVAREAAAMDSRQGSLWQSLDMLAMLAYKRGRIREAALILGRADAANVWRGQEFREPVEGDVRGDLLLALGRTLASTELSALLARGAALSDEEAARLALTD